MPHVIEHAASGRAKCRGCHHKIDKGELRFGERQPNAFGEGEMTSWFHLRCAACMRPGPFLEALAESGELPGAEALRAEAESGIRYRRLPRVSGVDRAPTGRARCRSCQELIEKDAWRLALVFFEEYRFQPSGFIHAGCARDYLGTLDVMERLRYFRPDLGEPDVQSLQNALHGGPPAGPSAQTPEKKRRPSRP